MGRRLKNYRDNDFFYMKQIKLLEDTVWGDEMGKVSWLEGLDFYKEAFDKGYEENFITVTVPTSNYLGRVYDKVVALAIIVPIKEELSLDGETFLRNERDFANIPTWDKNSKNWTFLTIMVHKDFRNNIDLKIVFNKKIDKFIKKNKIQKLYLSTVTKDGERYFKNKSTFIGEREEGRKAWEYNLGWQKVKPIIKNKKDLIN